MRKKYNMKKCNIKERKQEKCNIEKYEECNMKRVNNRNM